MSRTRRIIPLFLLLVLVPSSCKGPQDAFTKGVRSTFDVIRPAHQAYVEADPLLDAEQKARRIRTLDSLELLIKKAEGK